MKAAGFGCGCSGPGSSPAADAAWDLYASGFLDAMPGDEVSPPDVSHDAAVADTGSDAAAPDAGLPEIPPTPTAPTFDFYTELPCGFAASFEFRNDDGIKKLRTTCGLWPLGLFEATIDSDGSPSDWERLDDPDNVDGLPSNHLSLGNGSTIILHSAPNGLTALEATGISDVFLFGGINIGFDLTYPMGAAFVGDTLCITTNNFDDTSFAYHGATVALIPFRDGLFDHDATRVVRLAGQNATSLGVLDGQCVVLTANNYAPSAGELAYLHLVGSDSGTVTSSIPITISDTPLATRAQTIPFLATTSEKAVFGLEAPYRWVTVVDTVDGETTFYPLANTYDPVTWSYFTSTLLYDDRIVIASDYGLLATPEGRVHFVDISPSGWAESIFSPTEGVTGPAAIDEDKGVLYQAITDENGNGTLLRASLEGL